MLISIEGIDGTGKTTLAKLLTTHYKAKYIKFPSETEIGKLIREVLNETIVLSFNEAVTLQMLFAVDKLLKMDELFKSIYDIVIVDRYIDSAMVYGYLDNIPLQYTYELNKYLPIPQLTLILDASPETCLKRLKSRKETDYYEDESKLKILRAMYKELPTIYKTLDVDRRIQFLNAEKPIEELYNEAIKIIDDIYASLLFA